MADLPEIGYGTVTGRFVAGILDSDDPQVAPDAEPLEGRVEFWPTADVVLAASAAPPTTLLPEMVAAELDWQGYLSHGGSRGVNLFCTDDPDGNPVNWHWRAVFKLTRHGRIVPRAPFYFSLPCGSTIDLTTVAPVAVGDDGIIIIQGPPGPQGPQGEPGQGIKIMGSLPVPGPPPEDGTADGDFWIDSNGDGWVWDEEGGIWINTGPIQGPAGPPGPTGLQGEQGEKGPQGEVGATGAPGADSTVPGPTGPAGPAGADSTVPGPTGPAGPAGADSTVPGPAGPKGDKGDPGDVGATGPAGADSTVPGPVGPAGPQGEQGIQGVPGVKGDTGDTGPAGADSTVPGPQGPIGPEGPQGPAGSGVTIEGTIPTVGPPTSVQVPAPDPGDMWLDSNGDGWVWDGTQWTNVGPIRGPEGPQGETGATGPAGADSTVPGPVGPQGEQGPQGIQGIPGEDGADPVPATEVVAGIARYASQAEVDAGIEPASTVRPSTLAPYVAAQIAAIPPAEAGLKVYPDLASLNDVREAEVGTLHLDDLAAAFPQLAGAYPNVFAGHGPADIVVTSQIGDYPLDDGLFLNRAVLNQSFALGDWTTAGILRVTRILQFDRSTGETVYDTYAWEAEFSIPTATAAGQALISDESLNWVLRAASPFNGNNTFVLRDGDQRAQINDPLADADIVNKRFLDAAIAAIPPATGGFGVHRFLFDATPPGDPGAGRISIENVGGQDRLIRVSKTDADGGTVALALLAVNDSVALASTEPAPTIYARGYASTVATDAVTHWEFTAVRESGAGALPADGTPLNLALTMAHGGGAGGAGLKVYATLAELLDVRTGEIGTLHVDNLAAAFPELAISHPGAFAGTGPADLVITSVPADHSDADPSDFAIMLQTFSVPSSSSAYEDVYRTFFFLKSTGAFSNGGVWVVKPKPGTLKVYTSLTQVENVRTSEVGTLHVDNMAAAFPNLAVVGTGVEKFFGTGPGDLVITTTTVDSTFGSPPDMQVIHQSFKVGYGVPFATTVPGEVRTIHRTFGTKSGMNASGYNWYPEPYFPTTSYHGDMLIAGSAYPLPGLRWDLIHSSENDQPGTVMVRNAAGTSKVSDPTQPTDIANKQYVDSATADITAMLTGHGLPPEDVGEAGDFYIDLDSGAIYGPKRPYLFESDPFLLSGVPESFPNPGNIMAGVKFTVDAPGRVFGIRLYQFPDTIGNGRSVYLWDAATGAQLGLGSGTIEAHDEFVVEPLNTPVDVVPGVVYVASYAAYRPVSRSEAAVYPVVGENVTLTGAANGPPDSTMPDVDATGTYWVEPVFELPVTTLWPVAVAPASGAMKVYADMAEVGTLTQSEVGILSVPDMAAAFPIMALKEPSAFKAFPGSVVIHTTVTGDSATKNLVNQRIEVGDYWGPTVLAERTWMQNVVDPVPYTGGWYPGGVLPRPDDGTSNFVAGVREAGQYEQIPLQSEYAGKATVVYRDPTTGMAKILGPATDPQHIVNKQYVDDAVAGAGGGLPVYADMAAVDAVRTAEVGVLHVDNISLAFPDLVAKNRTFEATGPADLLVTSTVQDSIEADPGTTTIVLQQFSMDNAAVNGRFLGTYRVIHFNRADLTAPPSYIGPWTIESVFPNPYGDGYMLIGFMEPGVGTVWKDVRARSNPDPNGIIRRNANGGAQVTTPSSPAANDIANVGYVDGPKAHGEAYFNTEQVLPLDYWTAPTMVGPAIIRGGMTWNASNSAFDYPVDGVYLIALQFEVKSADPGTALTFKVMTDDEPTDFVQRFDVAGVGKIQTIEFSRVEFRTVGQGGIRVFIRPEGGTLIVTSGRLTATKIA